MTRPPLAPDAAVHGRDLALDAQAMGPRIARLLGHHGPVTVGRCERRRVKYRVGEGIRVLYAVELGGEARLVSLRTFAGDRSERVFARCADTAIDCGPLRGVVHDPELGAVLFAFPNDRKVGGLRALVADAPPGVAANRLVAYAPEKGATVRRLDADGRALAYAKAYAGDEGRRTRRTHDHLRGPAAAAGLCLPRALHYDERERILDCEALAGRPLAELRGAELECAVLGLGSALARLHRLPPPPGAQSFARFTPARLRRAAEVIAIARPDCADAAGSLAERLLAGTPSASGPVCLHGDVHPKNALVGIGVGLVDLDQVSVGPAVADLAGLLAALTYRRVVGADSTGAERRLGDALLAGYARAGGRLDPEALRWHVAAALLVERALRAVTRVRSAGLDALASLLAEGAATLAARSKVAA